MLVIHLSRVVKNPVPDFNEYFVNRLGEIINWGLGMPSDLIKRLVRSGDINLLLSAESNDYGEFINEALAEDPNGYVLSPDLKSLFVDFCKDKNIRANLTITQLEIRVIEQANALFGISVVRSRPAAEKSNDPF